MSWKPRGFVELLGAVQQVVDADSCTLEEAHACLVQAFGDGDLRCIAIDPSREAPSEIPPLFWRGADWPAAFQSGEIFWQMGDASTPFFLRQFIAGQVYVFEADLLAWLSGQLLPADEDDTSSTPVDQSDLSVGAGARHWSQAELSRWHAQRVAEFSTTATPSESDDVAAAREHFTKLNMTAPSREIIRKTRSAAGWVGKRGRPKKSRK